MVIVGFEFEEAVPGSDQLRKAQLIISNLIIDPEEVWIIFLYLPSSQQVLAQRSLNVKFVYDSDLLFSEKLRILQCSKIMASGL